MVHEVPLEQRFLSHRLRGFSRNEGSLEGLRKALAQGVPWLEIDTRITGDGTILVFHDSRLSDKTGSRGKVTDHDVLGLGRPEFAGRCSEQIPTLDEFLAEFARHRRSSKIMIDIKDRGTEAEHLRLIERHGLEKCVWIIAWTPAILLRVHEMAPSIPLGFSHVPVTRFGLLFRIVTPLLESRLPALLGGALALVGLGRNMQDVVFYSDEYNCPPAAHEPARGAFPIHIASELPHGKLGEVLRASHGGVGIPAQLLTREYVAVAHAEGLRVFVFSIDSLQRARQAVEETKVDIIFTNERALFKGEGSIQ